MDGEGQDWKQEAAKIVHIRNDRCLNGGSSSRKQRSTWKERSLGLVESVRCAIQLAVWGEGGK